jgi:hypothetical protein
MARFDKVDSTIGMTRAALAADVDPADYDTVLSVGLDATGHAVLGAAGNSGFVGVTIVDRTKRRAGQIIDIMKIGEIVECAGLAAGTKYYVQADGSVSAVRSAIYVGYTVEADRLSVDFDGKADAA